MLKITSEDTSAMLQDLDVALNLVKDSNISITEVSLQNDFTPIIFIFLDADVDTVVDLNFELADKIVDTYEGREFKYPIYFLVEGSFDFVI